MKVDADTLGFFAGLPSIDTSPGSDWKQAKAIQSRISRQETHMVTLVSAQNAVAAKA